MTKEDPHRTPTGYRIFSGVLGALLLGSGIYAMRFVGSSGVPQFVGAAVLIVLGVNEIASSIRARYSWLSKLGPIP